jgi:Flp pilus assembly protein TadG
MTAHELDDVRRGRTAAPLGEEGSITAELVVLAPVLAVFLLLIVALGRYELARQEVIAAARAAADAAAVVSSAGQAPLAASDAAGASIQSRHACAVLDVSTDTGQFVPGGSVRVTVTCRVDLSDVLLPGWPGSTTVQSIRIAPIDPFRSVQ